MGTPDQFTIAFKAADGSLQILPKRTLDEVEKTLWESKVLSFQIELPDQNKKSLLSNSPRPGKEHSTQRFLLFDRNVTSDIATLLRPDNSKYNDRRVASAVVLMMKICKLTPAALTSLQEFESQFGGIEAYNDAIDFCSCLAVPLEKQLAVFDGQVPSLTAQDVPSDLVFDRFENNAQPFQPATPWLACYAVVLKLVALQKQKGRTSIEKLRLFLQWLHESLFQTPLFLLIGSKFYSENREKGIIKGFNAPDPEKLKRNLLNAAWDVQILLEWHGKTKAGEFCILASTDNALKKVASRMATLISQPLTSPEKFIKEDWPTRRDHTSVIGDLLTYKSGVDSPTRAANRGLDRKYYVNLIGTLEAELFCPASSS